MSNFTAVTVLTRVMDEAGGCIFGSSLFQGRHHLPVTQCIRVSIRTCIGKIASKLLLLSMHNNGELFVLK